MFMFKFVNTLFLRKFWPSVLLKTNSGADLGICCKSWMVGSMLWIKIYLMLIFQQIALFVDSTSGATKITVIFLYLTWICLVCHQSIWRNAFQSWSTFDFSALEFWGIDQNCSYLLHLETFWFATQHLKWGIFFMNLSLPSLIKPWF